MSMKPSDLANAWNAAWSTTEPSGEAMLALANQIEKCGMTVHGVARDNFRKDQALVVAALRSAPQPVGNPLGPGTVPLPGELAMIQILWKAVNDIAAHYTAASTVQPVLIARDAIKSVKALTFESEPVSAILSLVPAEGAREADVDGLEEIIADLRRDKLLIEALKPFAAIALLQDSEPRAQDMIDAPDLAITPADVRRARAALSVSRPDRGGGDVKEG